MVELQSSASRLQRLCNNTSDIFDALAPGSTEVATIALAELASLEPVLTGQVAVKLADSYRLGKAEIGQLMSEAEQIGFVDAEKLSPDEILLFNGNLFRRETTQKIKAVQHRLVVCQGDLRNDK